MFHRFTLQLIISNIFVHLKTKLFIVYSYQIERRIKQLFHANIGVLKIEHLQLGDLSIHFSLKFHYYDETIVQCFVMFPMVVQK